MARGDSAEWCNKCKLLVLPVRIGAKQPYRWACPICQWPTQEPHNLTSTDERDMGHSGSANERDTSLPPINTAGC